MVDYNPLNRRQKVGFEEFSDKIEGYKEQQDAGDLLGEEKLPAVKMRDATNVVVSPSTFIHKRFCLRLQIVLRIFKMFKFC